MTSTGNINISHFPHHMGLSNKFIQTNTEKMTFLRKSQRKQIGPVEVPTFRQKSFLSRILHPNHSRRTTSFGGKIHGFGKRIAGSFSSRPSKTEKVTRVMKGK